MDFSLGIAIGYFEKDDIFNGRKYLEVFFEENNAKNKNIPQKDYENYKTILKKIFFEKLYTYINNKDYEKSTLILDCITAFVDEKEYNTSNFWATAGICFKDFNSLDCAIDCMKKATGFKTFNPDIFRQIGDIYYFDKDDKLNAISYYEKYIGYIKENPYVYNVLGHLYENVYKSEFWEKQIRYFEKAHKIMPENKEFLDNLILVTGKNKQVEKFKKYTKELLANNPTENDCYDYGCRCFNNKIFDEAHKYLFRRFFKENGATEYPNVTEKLWDGKEDLSQKTLLVRYEQGFGDTIMFCRFVPKLKNLAKDIIFKVQPQLFSLIKPNLPDITVVPDTKEYENIEYDRQIPLMELISVFKITDQNMIGKDKYLSVSEEKIKDFREKYIKDKKFNIGIAFNGKENYTGDNRDIPADLISKLADIKNVRLFSLQVNNNKDLTVCERYSKITDLAKVLNSFETTAAAIENMDLIVSTDNVILNLSAALGQKTFGIFNYYPDYRWFTLKGNDSGWYNSIQVYQNKKYDDWENTFEKIYSDVEKIVNQ